VRVKAAAGVGETADAAVVAAWARGKEDAVRARREGAVKVDAKNWDAAGQGPLCAGRIFGARLSLRDASRSPARWGGARIWR